MAYTIEWFKHGGTLEKDSNDALYEWLLDTAKHEDFTAHITEPGGRKLTVYARNNIVKIVDPGRKTVMLTKQGDQYQLVGDKPIKTVGEDRIIDIIADSV